MSTITISPARMGDAPAIAHLSRDLIEADLPWSWTPRRVASLMRQRESAAVIARDQNRLAGFILAQYGDESAHIALLGVANEYRRQGLGRRLVRWVEETATVAGLFVVRLEVRAVKRERAISTHGWGIARPIASTATTAASKTRSRCRGTCARCPRRNRPPQNRSPAGPGIICERTSGIGGPPYDRNSSLNSFHASRPPRLLDQSSRSLRIISLPSV